MVTNAAKGNGPIEIMDSGGSLVAIPLSSVFFDDGVIKGQGATYLANKAAFDALLAYLADQKIVEPAPGVIQPPAAALISAKKAGAAGNDIRVTFANPRPDPADNTKTIFDATLTQTDAYTNVAPADLGTTLGTSAATGSPAAAAFLSSAAAAAVLPKAGTYAATAAGVVSVPKNAGAGNAFQLTFRNVDAAAVMTAEVADVGPTAFTLRTTWTRTVVGTDIASIASAANFGALITVSGPPPAGGAPTLPPAAGTVVFAGGADSAAATAATATVLAG